MVNETGFEQAVKLSRENPRLGVGLHLTLLCGHSSLDQQTIPGLVNARGNSAPAQWKSGFDTFFKNRFANKSGREIHAQFEKFRATKLLLDHVNGHLHLHLHPTVFAILMSDAQELGIERLRLTVDPFLVKLRVWRKDIGVTGRSMPQFTMSWRGAPGMCSRSAAFDTQSWYLDYCKMGGLTSPSSTIASGPPGGRFGALLPSFAG